MKEIQIRKNDAGQRLDRFVGKAVPLLPESLLQKYIRLKRIKRNGKAAKRAVRLVEGDVLQLYINDEFFEKPTEHNAWLKIATPRLDIVYEDENILLADKKPGVLCHKGQVGAVISAVTHRHLHQPPGRGAADRGQSVPQAAQRGDQGIGIGLQRVQRDQQRRIGGHCFHHAGQLRRLHSGIQRHNLRVHLFTDLTAADGQHAAVPHGGKLDHNKNPLCVRYFGAGQELCGVALGSRAHIVRPYGP